MPSFLQDVRQFALDHTTGGTDNSADRFSAAFGLGSNEMLGIAIVDPEKPAEIAGHVIAGVEGYLGEQVCMVYQFNKKSGTSEAWTSVNKAIQAIVDNWCHTLGLKEIMAMAESKSRGRLFRQFGYTEGPVLMKRRFQE